ncbi:MAG: class I SAM-dependent methyltransferase, partial [Gemmataceae bacterium]|nr:class I SAM-dependent methyltransferase [Gemmataceae bacterium]
RREALAALDAGDGRSALALLLADQDPFAPLPPPDRATLGELIDGVDRGAVTRRCAMRALNFGPVADYFALRPSTPTFLSGLGLLSQCGGGRAVVEVACGIGQLLREPARRGGPVAGIDLVFSKLWLARRFVVPGARLVCGDVCGGPLAEPAAGVTVLCHDAFYFFADKPAAARSLVRLAGAGGRVLVGHAHNANWDHGVAGNLLTPAGYADLFPGCGAFDDAAFTAAHLSGTPAAPDDPAALGGIEAVSLAWPGRDGMTSRVPDRYAVPVAGTELVLNPLLEAVGGVLEPRWPSPRFAEEYRSASYLSGEPVPSAEVLAAAARGGLSAEVRRLARKRVLLPREDVG